MVVDEGDRIGADAVLFEANSLSVNMAALTGEAMPARRSAEADASEEILDARNIVFAGTTVASGNGLAVVFATGKETEFGRIALLSKEVEKRLTPMEIEITRITRILTLAALLVGGIFFGLGVLSGQGWPVAAIFALSLIVANVPEGMLPTITLSLSLASRNMAKRNALIKNLSSAQTLGSATVICTDKTGTITRNEMTMKEIRLSSGEEISVSGEGYFEDGDFSFDEERTGSGSAQLPPGSCRLELQGDDRRWGVRLRRSDGAGHRRRRQEGTNFRRWVPEGRGDPLHERQEDDVDDLREGWLEDHLLQGSAGGADQAVEPDRRRRWEDPAPGRPG